MSATKGTTIRCRAAVAWGAGQPMALEEIEVAPPTGREVRVKIVASGVCHSDLSGWLGRIANSFPSILGHEGAGIVESVGEAVTSIEEGDHVLTFCMPHCQQCHLCKSPDTNVCLRLLGQGIPRSRQDGDPPGLSCKGKELKTFMNCGTFTEYALLEEDYVSKVNKEAPLSKIVPISCGVATGYGSAVKFAKVKPGSTCAVFGLGTVGLAVVMGCKQQGAKRIIGIDINSEKQDVAKKFGLTEFYNPTEQKRSIEDILVERMGGGCDYAFECIGNTAVIESAFKSCRVVGSHCIMIGVPPMGENISLDPLHFFHGRNISGCAMGGYTTKDLPGLVDSYVRKKILVDEFITSTSSLEDVNKAFENIGKGTSIKHVMIF